MKIGNAISLAALILLAGCVSPGPAEVQEVTYYNVSIELPARADRSSDLTILLRPFDAYEELDREGVHYLTSDVEGGYWTSHLWSEPVAAMVEEETGRYLEATGLFATVLILDNAAAGDLVLDGQVRRFEEVDRPDGWSGVVEISFELTRIEDGEVLYHRTILEEESCKDKTVREVVRALGRGFERVLGSLATDLETLVKGVGR